MVDLTSKSPAVSRPSLLGVPDDDLILRVRGSQHGGQVVRISAPKCTVGSDERCTLRLRAAGLEPLHLLILRGRRTTVVRSLHEKTRLNGRQFDVASLAIGDRLGIGPLELDVVDDQAARPVPQPAPPAMTLTDGRAAAASLRQVVEQSRQQADRLKSALANTRQVAAKRVRKLADQLRATRQQVQQLQATARLKGDQSADAEQRLARRQQELERQFDQRRRDLAAELDRRQAELDARVAELAAREEQLLSDRAAHEREAEASREQLASERDALVRESDELQRRWTQQHAQIEDQQGRKQQEIEQARQAVEAELESLSEQRNLFEQQQSVWEQERERLEGELELRAAELERQGNHLADAQAELAAAGEELKSLRTELQQIRQADADRRSPPPADPQPEVPHEGYVTEEPPPHVPPSPRMPGDEYAFDAGAAVDPVPAVGGDVFVIPSVPPQQDAAEPPAPTDPFVADEAPRPEVPHAAESGADEPATDRPETLQFPQSPAVTDSPTPPQNPAPAPAPTDSQEDEESVEAYMARLLERMRGDEPVSPTPAESEIVVEDLAPACDADATTDESPPSAVAAPAESEESETSEYKPRQQAPETKTALGTFRELANTSARSAIDRHQQRASVKDARRKMAAAGMAVMGAAGFVIFQPVIGSLAFAGTGVALGLTALWVIAAARLARQARLAATIPEGGPPADDDSRDVEQ